MCATAASKALKKHDSATKLCRCLIWTVMENKQAPASKVISRSCLSTGISAGYQPEINVLAAAATQAARSSLKLE